MWIRCPTIFKIHKYSYINSKSISSLISFSSAIISFMNSCYNLNLDSLCLVGSGASSGLGSRIEILSKFFIGNNLLLKLLRNVSFAQKK